MNLKIINPSTIEVEAKVTNISETPIADNANLCHVELSDVGGAYEGIGGVIVYGTLHRGTHKAIGFKRADYVPLLPGESLLGKKSIMISNEGAAFITEVKLKCSCYGKKCVQGKK